MKTKISLVLVQNGKQSLVLSEEYQVDPNTKINDFQSSLSQDFEEQYQVLGKDKKNSSPPLKTVIEAVQEGKVFVSAKNLFVSIMKVQSKGQTDVVSKYRLKPTMSAQDFITELEKKKCVVLSSLLNSDKKTPVDKLKFSIKNYVFDSKIYVSIKDKEHGERQLFEKTLQQKSKDDKLTNPTIIKKMSQPKQTAKKRQKRVSWSQAEERMLYQIVSRGIRNFDSKFMRKSKKIFVKMAKRIRSKTPGQCRNHFKNIQRKFRSIQHYLQYMEMEFQKISLAKHLQASLGLRNEQLEYIEKNNPDQEYSQFQIQEPNSLQSLLDLRFINRSYELIQEPEMCLYEESQSWLHLNSFALEKSK